MFEQSGPEGDRDDVRPASPRPGEPVNRPLLLRASMLACELSASGVTIEKAAQICEMLGLPVDEFGITHINGYLTGEYDFSPSYLAACEARGKLATVTRVEEHEFGPDGFDPSRSVSISDFSRAPDLELRAGVDGNLILQVRCKYLSAEAGQELAELDWSVLSRICRILESAPLGANLADIPHEKRGDFFTLLPGNGVMVTMRPLESPDDADPLSSRTAAISIRNTLYRAGVVFCPHEVRLIDVDPSLFPDVFRVLGLTPLRSRDGLTLASSLLDTAMDPEAGLDSRVLSSLSRVRHPSRLRAEQSVSLGQIDDGGGGWLEEAEPERTGAGSRAVSAGPHRFRFSPAEGWSFSMGFPISTPIGRAHVRFHASDDDDWYRENGFEPGERKLFPTIHIRYSADELRRSGDFEGMDRLIGKLASILGAGDDWASVLEVHSNYRLPTDLSRSAGSSTIELVRAAFPNLPPVAG